MPAYRYEALDAGGRAHSGVVQADTPRHARSELRARGLLPSRIAPVRASPGKPWARRIKASELSLITRQFATLLESGLTVEHALAALIDATGDPKAREVLAGVRAEVSAGVDLAGALQAHEETFPEFYSALVRGGEEAGALPRVLAHLADHLEARETIRQKTALALLYPALVTGVALLIVAGLLAYVVPQVVQVFEHSRQTLPFMTRALIAVSDAVRTAAPYALAFAALGVLAWRSAMRRSAFRMRRDALVLKTPGIGALARSADTARFASTLAILTGGGVPLTAALQSAARGVKNLVVREAVHDTLAQVREGASLARALAATGVFPPMLIHLTASGEASGTLRAMLGRAAALEQQSFERRLAVFLTLLEPALILAMGAFVLAIVLAILMPIVSLNQLVR